MLLSSCSVALLSSSFIMSEWSDFYRTLNRIGPKLLAGVDPELQGIIQLEASDTDALFSDGLVHIFETWWRAGEYEKATFDALEEWARNVIDHLGQLLGPHSAFPSVA